MKQLKKVKSEIKKAVIGKDDIIDKVLMTMLARGHILLEDIPGVGKTNFALALSKSMQLDYRRIQLTSDVLPSDIVGFTMYNPKTQKFEYKEGAAFCHLLLADEINRTSSKTQSALLQLMEEGKITVDGQTYLLPEPFFVIATQNPIGSVGTQPLPDSQLDRFMVKLSLGYPTIEDEIIILKARQRENPIEAIQSVMNEQDLIQLQKMTDNVYLDDRVYHYIVSLVNTSRHHHYVKQGASPRGSLALMKMAKASAIIKSRDYVIPWDVKETIHMTIAHRLILNEEAKMKDISAYEVIDDILKQVKEPDII